MIQADPVKPFNLVISFKTFFDIWAVLLKDVVGEGEGGKCQLKFGLCQLIINGCLVIAARTGQPPVFVLKASENSIFGEV